jgi:hypothetical protein
MMMMGQKTIMRVATKSSPFVWAYESEAVEISPTFINLLATHASCCYSFLDPMFAGRLTKANERNIFLKTLFELFSALFILPLCCQNHQVFLD